MEYVPIAIDVIHRNRVGLGNDRKRLAVFVFTEVIDELVSLIAKHRFYLVDTRSEGLEVVVEVLSCGNPVGELATCNHLHAVVAIKRIAFVFIDEVDQSIRSIPSRVLAKGLWTDRCGLPDRQPRWNFLADVVRV